MSSMAENLKINGTPKLLRSSSFQRFKCTAFYPFQLAGTKLTKQSITRLIENFIQRTHILLHSTLIISRLPASKYIASVIVCLVELLAKLLGLKLAEREMASSEKCAPIVSPVMVTPKTECSVLSPAEVTYRNNLGRFLSTSATEEPPKDNTLISIISSVCVVLTFLQVAFLCCLLTTVILPWGFLFLISNIMTIAVFLVQIMRLNEVQTNKINAKKIKMKCNGIRTAENDGDRTENDVPANTRLSRDSTRRFLYFGNKTLSKIKLL